MHKPFEHTLTPADRIIVQKWLVGASLFVASTTLLILGFAIADHRRNALTAANEAAAQSDSPGQPSCWSSGQADKTLCVPQIDRR